MARRFRYQGARRMASYGAMRARRSYRRYGGARGIAGISLPYIGGAALGYFAPRISPYQDVAITLLAILPVRLPYNVQNIAKGYVLGGIAKAYMPGIGSGLLGSGAQPTNSQYV